MDEFRITKNKIEGYNLEYVLEGLTIGFINFRVEGYNLQEFKILCSKKDFLEIFPTGKVLYIQKLWVDIDWRGKGIGKELVKRFLNFAYKKFSATDVEYIALYALPMNFDNYVLPLPLLKKFYLKCGFEYIEFKNLETYKPHLYWEYENNFMFKKI